MKSTIALTPSKRIIVQPCKTGGIVLEVVHGASGGPKTTEAFHIDAGQAGCLLFGIEQAMAAQAAQGVAA